VPDRLRGHLARAAPLGMREIPDFAASIAYLEDLSSRPVLPWRQVGLGRTIVMLAALGDPQRAFATIQVAGTAGKGSTTTMAAAILREAGYHTGAFTSPHLQSYRERIAIDGSPIDEDLWVDALSRIAPLVARMERGELPGYSLGRPTLFEVTWAMAALVFAERGVRCAVVEAGVGGRVDPTSVNAALVAVITNVSLDHTERLGPTVAAIAAEKAGLIRPGQLVISAAEGEALAIIAATCAERGATLWQVRALPSNDTAGHDVLFDTASDTSPSQKEVLVVPDTNAADATLAIRTPLHTFAGLRPSLLGAHQYRNAGCAVAAVDALAVAESLIVAPAAVAAGLAAARIPGRMELFPGRPAILLDGAKSQAGAEALAGALRSVYAGRRIVLVLGVLGDKDVEAIAAALSPLADAVVVTEPPWEKRAGAAARVAEAARTHTAHVEMRPVVGDALARARALAGPDDLIVVAGSLYLVGAVRDLLLPQTR